MEIPSCYEREGQGFVLPRVVLEGKTGFDGVDEEAAYFTGRDV